MAKGKTRCNICGKELSEDVEKEHIGIHHKIGYGSIHDGETIDSSRNILKIVKSIRFQRKIKIRMY